MKLTPLDIQQQQFRIRMRGFDVREVDTFLEKISDSIETLHHENAQLRAEIHKLGLEQQGYQKREESFRVAMLNSQKVLEQMKIEARKSAELVMANAEMTADKIVTRAHHRLAQLQEDISELKRQRLQLQVQIGATLEAQAKLLEMSKEGMAEMDREDEKLRLIAPHQTTSQTRLVGQGR